MNLKEFRECELKISQKELADLTNETIENIILLENDNKKITVDFLFKLSRETGTSIDELMKYEKEVSKEIKVNNTWEQLDFIKKTIVSYIEKYSFPKSLKDEYENMILKLDNEVKSLIVKPKVTIIGLSDAGKSTMINSLLGKDKMPTSWTPTTAINVHIKHIKDRPDFMTEEIYFYKMSLDKNNSFDERNIYDKSYHNQYLAESGDIKLLEKYGVRQGQLNDEIGSAIVFVDSPILEICDLIDLPGFGTGDRNNDNVLTEKATATADMIIYMSPANGFLRGTDLEFLKSAINILPIIENKETNIEPLSNLFIVASQAHTINRGNRAELNTILDKGCDRLFNQIPEEIWENRSDVSNMSYTRDVLKKRFFPYTIDIPTLKENFEENLISFIESYPKLLQNKVIDIIKSNVKDNTTKLEKDLEHYKKLINQREIFKEQLEILKRNEPKRKQEYVTLRNEVLLSIKELKIKSKNDFKLEYNELITVDSIISIIEEKGYKKKKEDLELLAGYISSKLQARLQKVLKNKSKEFNNKIEDYLSKFDDLIKDNDSSIELKVFDIPFDTKRIFASGLAGLATLGGLAIWASTLGNLGAYILVAKGVSILSAVGISVAGGTAGAAAGVAAIGGPIVLGIVLASLVGLAVFSFFTGGWKKDIAKKMISEYEKQDVLNKFNSIINKHWDETFDAFNLAADNLEKQFQKNIDDLEKMVNNFEIDTYIKQAESIKSFFSNIPLKIKQSLALEQLDNDSLFTDVLNNYNRELSVEKNQETKLMLSNLKNIIEDMIEQKLYKNNSTTYIMNKEICEKFSYYLENAKESLYIISPWMNSYVINNEFLTKLNILLSKGVKVRIIYGISSEEDMDNNYRDKNTNDIAYKLKDIAKYYGDLFKIEHGQTHEKLVICDRKYYINGSFNFLSYSYNNNEYFRNEGSTYSEDTELINKTIKFRFNE